MLGGLLGLGLDIEVPLEAVGAAIVAGHGEEAGQVVQLQPHVGVEQGLIALAAAPEHIAGGAQLNGGVDTGLYLGGGHGKHVGAAGGGGPRHKLLVAKIVGGNPQAFLVVLLLELLQVGHHETEVFQALPHRGPLGRHIHVMEAVVVQVQLIHQAESKVGLGPEFGHGIPLAKALVHGAAAKHIHTLGADGVPVAHGELQVFPHGLPGQHLVGVVVFEGKRLVTVRPRIGDFGDFLIAFHGNTLPL